MTSTTDIPSDKIYNFTAVYERQDDPDPPHIVRNKKETLKLLNQVVNGAEQSYNHNNKHSAFLLLAVKFPSKDDALAFVATLRSYIKEHISPWVSVNQQIFRNHKNTLNLTIVIADSLTKVNEMTKHIEKFLLEGEEHITLPATH